MAEDSVGAGTSRQKLSSLEEYENAIDRIIGKASRTLYVFEKTLNTRYGSTLRYDTFRAFLLANSYNRLSIVVHEADTLDRNCPRLLQLLRQFSHSL